MTLKKSLENRIRGWLPKEPSWPKQPMQSPQRTAPQQPMFQTQNRNLETRTGMRIVPLYGLLGFFWTLLAVLNTLRGFAYPYFFPWQLTLLVVIVGCVLGVAIGAAAARFQIGNLTKKGEIRLRTQIPLLLVLIGSTFIILSIGFYFLPQISPQNQEQLLISLHWIVPALCFTIVTFFSSWERKYKRTILSGIWGGIYVSPKLDASMVSANGDIKDRYRLASH